MAMKIYLAHALSNASKDFHQRMITLRQRLNSIPDVSVLQFAWIDGVGPREGINVYEHDMKCVNEADIMVAVLDHFSFGVGMEIQRRCQLHKPLRCFAFDGMKVPKIIIDCMGFYKKEDPKSDFVPVVFYKSDDDLFKTISASLRSFTK
jgi:nucleoside 2-deoxyribosyltransferase